MAVRSVGYNRVRPGVGNPLLKHPWHHWFDGKKGRVLPTLTIVHVISGFGHYRSKESGEMEVPAGSLIFAFPNVRHSYASDAKTGWDDEWIEIEADAILPALLRVGITPQRPIVGLDSGIQVLRSFRQVFAMARHGASEGRLAASAYDVVATIVDQVGNRQKSASPVEAIKAILSDLDERPLPELSKSVGLSPSRFRTVFRNAVGMSPKRYQLDCRMKHAARLLCKTPAPIVEIASEVGFGPAAFSSAFRKTFGCSPREYRASR